MNWMCLPMNKMRKTKIVVTIGPQSLEEGMIEKLNFAGMDIARLNGSHNSLEWHRNAIEIIRKKAPKLPILIDLPGKKIRTLEVSLDLQIGSRFLLTNNITVISDVPMVGTNYPDLARAIKVGTIFYADDGTLKFQVIDSSKNGILCESLSIGTLKSKKGLNFPQQLLNIPPVRERDIALLELINNAKIDLVGISFVNSASEVIAIKKLLANSATKCVSKIETQHGIDNLAEIVNVSDLVMIDRGDLSVETSLPMISVNQKYIIEVSNKFNCPVIVATEVLNSMILNQQPTKAEISDITNAVLDGASAIMLSGETAIGNFPLECITTMHEVILATEEHSQNNKSNFSLQEFSKVSDDSIHDALLLTLAELSKQKEISKLVLVIKHGFAAKKLSTLNLHLNILAVSNNVEVVRFLNALHGVSGILLEQEFLSTGTDHFVSILKELKSQSVLKLEDVVAIAGITYPKTKTRLNTLAIYRMSDLL